MFKREKKSSLLNPNLTEVVHSTLDSDCGFKMKADATGLYIGPEVRHHEQGADFVQKSLLISDMQSLQAFAAQVSVAWQDHLDMKRCIQEKILS